jgi:hypothetical protein
MTANTKNMSNSISKQLIKRTKKQMNNEVMRLYVCIIHALATEVVLFFKLGGNEVYLSTNCTNWYPDRKVYLCFNCGCSKTSFPPTEVVFVIKLGGNEVCLSTNRYLRTAQKNGTQLCFNCGRPNCGCPNYGRPKTSFPPNLKNKTTSVASVAITYTITSLPYYTSHESILIKNMK